MFFFFGLWSIVLILSKLILPFLFFKLIAPQRKTFIYTTTTTSNILFMFSKLFLASLFTTICPLRNGIEHHLQGTNTPLEKHMRLKPHHVLGMCTL